MSWTPRTTAVTTGSAPYDWTSPNLYQCTWYAYARVQEGSRLAEPPCWYSGSGSTGYGSYTNARYWLDHYRTPWQAIPYRSDYKCSVGDIVVFTGTYGHVVVVEKVNRDGSLCVSDYNLIGGHNSFGYKTNYFYGNTITGAGGSTGACIGVLHNPNIKSSNILAPLYKKIKRRRRYHNYVKL